MKFDRQKIILFIAKYVSYIINVLIILGVLALIGWWIYQLYLSAQLTNYHPS